MLIDTSTRAVTLSAGRLIIHAEGKGSVSGRRLETTLRWLRALCSNNQKDERAPLRLQILDLQGNLMLASDDAGALVDVVIGGLISATILTLIVLPTLYVIFERRYHKSISGGARMRVRMRVPVKTKRMRCMTTVTDLAGVAKTLTRTVAQTSIRGFRSLQTWR